MSQGSQKDFKRSLQEFNPNFTIVSQDYFLRFPNSTFSMVLVEEDDGLQSAHLLRAFAQVGLGSAHHLRAIAQLGLGNASFTAPSRY